MEFIKKNYEKVLLVVVLLGLTIAACLMPLLISSKRNALEALRTNKKPHVKELPPVDMTMEDSALQRARTPLRLDFTTKHNIFNPVLWKKLPDGSLRKYVTGNEEGVGALEVTKVTPLYMELSYGSPSANGYLVNIDRQAAVRADKRHTQNFVSLEHSGELVGLKAIKGPPDKPTDLILEWNETGDIIDMPTDKPSRHVDGYAADLKYTPDNKTWTDQRVGSRPLFFYNGYYNIVAITESNVVVLDQSNNKKTTISIHSATEPR
jgi:hypothetical protein